jgi:hypothetical protein
MTPTHPEHLFNEFTDQNFVLHTAETDTVEKALKWLRAYTLSEFEETEMVPVWLKPAPVPEEMADYYPEAEVWYHECEDGIDDPDAVAYWAEVV